MVLCVQPSEACTGISLRSEDGSPVIARTIEWAGSDLNSRYVVVPRGYRQRSYTPSGQKDGMRFAAKYGYVGLAVERDEFVVDGMNEAGLAAGLFYFPQYGEYEPFDSTLVDESISDMQVVSWLLSRCASVDEAVSALQRVQIIATDPRGSTVHWRIADRTGKQVVVEVIAQQIRFYENTIGVLTNSPAFDWHLTNLNNYINLRAGAIPRAQMFADELVVGHINLPDIISPNCRIVRVSGDSMSPVIRNGDYIAVRELSNSNHIFWGQIYVVMLDDFRLVKYVRRHTDPNLVILRSENPNYDDMEISRFDIRELMMVQNIIHLDTRN